MSNRHKEYIKSEKQSSNLEGLSNRVFNAVKRAGFETKKCLEEYVKQNGIESLKKFNGIGKAAINEIINVLGV